MENIRKINSGLVIKTLIIASFLLLISWLLYLVFHTKTLSETSLFIQYLGVSSVFYGLLKFSSRESFLNQ